MADPRTVTHVGRVAPPEGIFGTLVEQYSNVRRWNEQRRWGFSTAELNAVDLTPCRHADPLVVDVIAVYLPAGDELDGVRRSCDELWSVAAARQPNAWSWDWYLDRWGNVPKPVRLLDGIEHRPGVRRVTLDLGAHWEPGRFVRPVRIRGANSAHAEILAAAAHFPRWVRAMDGASVPYIWAAGYQITIPEGAAHTRLPSLAWSGFRRTVSLTANWVDHSHSGWAAPVVRRAPVTASAAG